MDPYAAYMGQPVTDAHVMQATTSLPDPLYFFVSMKAHFSFPEVPLHMNV